MCRLSWNLGASTVQACLGIFLLIISPHLLPHTLASLYLLPAACYGFVFTIQFSIPQGLASARHQAHLGNQKWGTFHPCLENTIIYWLLWWTFQMSRSHTTIANRSTYCRCILYFTKLSQLCSVWNSAESLQQEEITAGWKHCLMWSFTMCTFHQMLLEQWTLKIGWAWPCITRVRCDKFIQNFSWQIRAALTSRKVHA